MAGPRSDGRKIARSALPFRPTDRIRVSSSDKIMKKRLFLTLLPALALAALAPSLIQAETGSLKIIKFEADWCGACKQMKPIFSSVAKSTQGVAFETVNVDRQADLADRYKVELLPTVVAVKDGKEVGRFTGFRNEAKLKSFVKKHR
jgi:thioredoxin 1